MKVSPVELNADVEAMQVSTASTYCPVCGTWAADLAEITRHKESIKHKRNRLFHVYQVLERNIFSSYFLYLVSMKKRKC